MLNLVRGFLKDEDGMGTLEIVIIIGVLVALALIFKDAIGKYAKALMEKFFNVNDVDNDLPDPVIPQNP